MVKDRVWFTYIKTKINTKDIHEYTDRGSGNKSRYPTKTVIVYNTYQRGYYEGGHKEGLNAMFRSTVFARSSKPKRVGEVI